METPLCISINEADTKTVVCTEDLCNVMDLEVSEATALKG